MRDSYRKTLTWLAVLISGALVSAWAFPRAFPYIPANWQISRVEAEEFAHEELRALGPLPERPYVVAQADDNPGVVVRLLQASRDGLEGRVRESGLDKRVLSWLVTVYASQAHLRDWSYQANIAYYGTVLCLAKGFKLTD